MKKTYIELGKEQGLEQGLEDGKIQGKQENTIEIAKKMLSEKFEMAIISKITGLSIEDIKKIDK